MKNRIFNLYADFVCEACGILKTDLFSKKKKKLRLYSQARFMLFYICSVDNMKTIEIKNLCVLNGYTLLRQNIDYGIEKITNTIDKPENKEMRQVIQSCLRKYKDE